MDAACIHEQGQARPSSQEQCSSSRERMALSNHSTFLRNHIAAKHVENVTANIAPLQKGDNKPADCSLSASRNSCLRLDSNINVATQALCFTYNLAFSDGERNVMTFSLSKIEEQCEDFSKQRQSKRDVTQSCSNLEPQEGLSPLNNPCDVGIRVSL